jgi:hypothetical protein
MELYILIPLVIFVWAFAMALTVGHLDSFDWTSDSRWQFVLGLLWPLTWSFFVLVVIPASIGVWISEKIGKAFG